ncbi:MAG: hypothetical protein PHH01_01170 [Patescibacteria group bacterium]|nr:hypothetical protein [Patescibacteria group bacterium]
MEDTQPKVQPKTAPAKPAQTQASQPAPEEQKFINRPSFGAFSLGWIYFLATGLVKDGLLMFVPVYNVYIWIRGIINGRKMSWAKGEWRDFATFKKRQKLLDRIGLVFLVIWLALMVIIFVTVFAATRTQVKVGDQFMHDLAAGQVEQAYNGTTDEFKNVGTLEEFQEFVNFYPKLSELDKVNFSEVSVVGNETALIGVWTTKTDEKFNVDMTLIKVNDVWKVNTLRFPE